MSDRTFKQISNGANAIYFVLFIVFIIYNVSFRPPTEVPITPPNSGWVLQPIVDSFFIALAGLIFLFLGIVNTIVVWTRTADEYVQLLASLSISRWSKRWFSILPNKYWLWQNRIISPLMVLMGLLVFLAGMYSLLRHFF